MEIVGLRAKGQILFIEDFKGCFISANSLDPSYRYQYKVRLIYSLVLMGNLVV